MVIFIAIRKGIDMGVMEQRFLSFAPWETLGADAHVIVLDERFTFVVGVLLVGKVAVHAAEDDCWECHEKGQVLPHFVAT